MNNSDKRILKIFSALLILGTIFTTAMCIVLLEAGLFIPNLSIETSPRIPIFTPTPLPNTAEEVKAICSNGECINACLAHVDRQLRETGIDSYEYSGDEVLLVYYGISNEDELEKPRKIGVPTELLLYQQDETTHKIIWDYYRTLIPREKRPNLVTFGIYIDTATAGNFDTTATENWITNINVLSLENARTLSDVVVHEYGHYLTLNETQRQNDSSVRYCRQEALYYCQSQDSYLNLFYLEFWEDIYPEWEKVNKRLSLYDYDEKMKAFHNKYNNRFLNNYAATHPIEDIAESWTAFVLEPTPTGDSIAEQKIKFFYNFPELVQLRYQIISGICTFEATQ